MNDEKKYPELIRRLRKRIGVSQEKFASQVGVVLATIYRYEGGKSDPDPPILAKLIEFAEKEAPDIAAPLRDEYRRLFGAALTGSQLTPALCASVIAGGASDCVCLSALTPPLLARQVSDFSFFYCGLLCLVDYIIFSTSVLSRL